MERANPQGQALLQQGIAAARAKRKGEAYQLLRQVVTTDPRSTEAWLWLGAVAPTAQEQLQAFEQVLALDPANEKAQTGRRWALGRLGGGTGAPAPSAPVVPPAPAPPPRPAPGGGSGISSQDMLGMFGGVPGGGAAAPPSPTGGGGRISSQDMLGMFGGPGAPAAPPPAAPGGLGSADLAGMFGSAPAPASPAPPAADTAPYARSTDTNLDLSTPQPFDPSMFGAVPAVPPAPPSPLPPGAPGTPGGAEWRGYSDLREPEAFNWDDPGLGLSTSEQVATAVPTGTGSAARPADTYGAAPSLFSDLDRDEEVARPAETAGAEEEMPPPLQAERRGTPPLVILGAVALIILLLLVGILSALTANKTITLGAVAGPEDTVRGFLTAHVQGLTTDAAGYLAPSLAGEYRQADSALRTSLPDPRQQRGLGVRVAPLATSGDTAEVYGFFTTTATPAPATLNPGPWTFSLAKSNGTWLITGITPP
jgi:hypothetical protein